MKCPHCCAEAADQLAGAVSELTVEDEPLVPYVVAAVA